MKLFSIFKKNPEDLRRDELIRKINNKRETLKMYKSHKEDPLKVYNALKNLDDNRIIRLSVPMVSHEYDIIVDKSYLTDVLAYSEGTFKLMIEQIEIEIEELEKELSKI